MKRIKQHLSELPEPYNWLALEEEINEHLLNSKVINQRDALNSFIWCFSKLGFDFWDGVDDNLKHIK